MFTSTWQSAKFDAETEGAKVTFEALSYKVLCIKFVQNV